MPTIKKADKFLDSTICHWTQNFFEQGKKWLSSFQCSDKFFYHLIFILPRKRSLYSAKQKSENAQPLFCFFLN